ncbi:MAG TPA: hypothetical protein PLR25_12270 [Planctomycetaceae bacterium]|nr:hypothetical protein [Planctomycetaceae bacterium]
MNETYSAQQVSWLLCSLAFMFVSAITIAQHAPLQQPRQPDGDGSIVVGSELKQWHKHPCIS